MQSSSRYFRVSLMTLFCSAPAGVFSQTIVTGDLTAAVKDTANSIVVGANLDLKHWDTRATPVVTSNPSGTYRLNSALAATRTTNGRDVGISNSILRKQ